MTESAIPEEKLCLLFALLFSSPEAVTLDRIREILYPANPEETDSEESASPREHLEALEAWIQEKGLPLQLQQIGRAWRLLTIEDYAEVLAPVQRKVHAERMGPAAMEVLALVAYRQPVLKADIDSIRGVKSGPHLRHLLDLRFVRILGRADLPGRPFLYSTTKEFLDRFGLRDLKDLPESGRLAAPAEAPPKEEPEISDPEADAPVAQAATQE